MGLNVGDVIDGKYRIIRMIGEGGMGAVFEGENTRIRRRIAIKVLNAISAANAEAVERFEREAQAAGRIGNDHILEVLDLGILPDGDRYIVMEFLDGESLTSRIERNGRMSPLEIAPIAKQILAALAAAHGAGIIHRDMKPDNVFILREKAGQPDFVKLIDFGISKFSAEGENFAMTRAGSMLGTPYYMTPEQARGGQAADLRGDLYSLGVILYEAVTGRVPFDGGTFNELLFNIVLAEPTPIEQLVLDIDSEFSDIIAKAMNREPAERYQSAAEFSEAIDKWLRSQGWSTNLLVDPSRFSAPAYNALGQSSPGAMPATAPSFLGSSITTNPGVASNRRIHASEPAGVPSSPNSSVTRVADLPKGNADPSLGSTLAPDNPSVAAHQPLRGTRMDASVWSQSGPGAPSSVSGAKRSRTTPLVAVGAAATFVVIGGAVLLVHSMKSKDAHGPSATPALLVTEQSATSPVRSDASPVQTGAATPSLEIIEVGAADGGPHEATASPHTTSVRAAPASHSKTKSKATPDFGY